MKGICPICEAVRTLEYVDTIEEVVVRGEAVKVNAHYLKCTTCNEEFDDPESSYDQAEAAYREYRKCHGMLQPEEIRELRDKFSLTQVELAKLLGWGLVTISRYENGALQEPSHEKSLRLASDPRNLLKLVRETPNAFTSTKKRENLIRELQVIEEGSHDFETLLEECYGSYRPNEYSGYKGFDLSRFMNAILYFCKNGVFKTKLNKLLFYADFKHYKEYGLSITGAKYARLPHGPVPDKFDHYYAVLIHEDEALEVEEVCFDRFCGEELKSAKDADLSIFTPTELLVLSMVNEKFGSMSAKEIRDFSHEEKGYVETSHTMLISYSYAGELHI